MTPQMEREFALISTATMKAMSMGRDLGGNLGDETIKRAMETQHAANRAVERGDAATVNDLMRLLEKLASKPTWRQ